MTRVAPARWVTTIIVVATAGFLVAQRPTAPVAEPNVYVDPATCATCHEAIADTFRKTGMGRSFYKLKPTNVVEALGRPFYHEGSDSYFLMFERNGKYYQRRWQKDFDGKETNIDEKQVDYVMGSGNHGRTYLHLTGHNTLQQLPMGWYAEKGGYWAMSPGFDRPDYPGSTRVVTYECMFCHNAYPQIPAGHDNAGSSPQFQEPLPEGIECQRCHGPGQQHVALAGRPGTPVAQVRAAIVNPKRLSPQREEEVCLQCHLETTAVALPHDIRRFDRSPFSYVPGQPLGDFRPTYDRANGMGDRFEVAHAAYRMRESQCYLQSEGKLRCTTCHDPHNVRHGEQEAARYNAICSGCHSTAPTTQTVAKPVPTSPGHTATANCVGCHMPKRRTEDAVYMVMTDHYIRRTQPPGDLTAARQETHDTPATSYRGEVVPYYPKATTSAEDALYLALAQIIESSNLPAGIPRLQSLLETQKPPQPEFYTDLAEGLNAIRQPARALPWFEEAARLAPDSEVTLRKFGSALMDARQLPRAETLLRRATELVPDDAGAWGILSQVLWREGKNPEAEATVRKGIATDPELPDLHSSLANLLLAKSDNAGAEQEFREAMRIQPNSGPVQANLASLLASHGEAAEARFHFERSIRLKPDLADARLNYARLLTSLKEMDAAEVQAQAAVESNPGLADAHYLWGALLANKGDVDAAVRELQTAVNLEPNFWRAHYDLGVALGRKRDNVAARQHLRIAAEGDDASVKAAAQQLLERLGN